MSSEGKENNLEACVRKSNAVITGVRVEGYMHRLPTQWTAEGSIVVDFTSYKNILQTKDAQSASMVGKVNVVMLERNHIRLFETYHQLDLSREKVCDGRHSFLRKK